MSASSKGQKITILCSTRGLKPIEEGWVEGKGLLEVKMDEIKIKGKRLLEIKMDGIKVKWKGLLKIKMDDIKVKQEQ